VLRVSHHELRKMMFRELHERLPVYVAVYLDFYFAVYLIACLIAYIGQQMNALRNSRCWMGFC